jgi:hypothetical protein
MRIHSAIVATLFAAALPAAALANGMLAWGVWDAPSAYFPGKYFEHKAQFYLKNKDYRAALQMFELSGFWADKVAQYNAGIMYYSGVGVPVDKPRGAAWLSIAAQSHEDLAERARQIAYAGLDDAERAKADEIARELDAKYGDAVALPRAITRFEMDSHVSLFQFGGSGDVYSCDGGPTCGSETGSDFVQRMRAQRDELVAQITGHVTVGAVEALPVAPEARKHASGAVIDVPAKPPAQPPDTH